jgi:hypothetical protein
MDGKRSVWWFVAFVIVMLMVGGTAGIVLDRSYIRPHRLAAAGPDGLPGPPGARPHGWLLGRLDRRLQLTPEQHQQVDAILRKRGERIEQMRREMRDKMDAEARDLHAEIRTVLDPAQQKTFDEMLANGPGGARPGRMWMRRGEPPPDPE